MKMNTPAKDKIYNQDCDVICKNHTATTERDLCRVCPSKLSKRELENLYYALIENNIELKKALHSQQDKLKTLSTKLQRMMAAQRNAAGKEKACCNSKVTVDEQKHIIEDLTNTNDRMTDRIKLLNMRLCSAKQFLKKTPMPPCTKCIKSATAPGSFKNSSMCALNENPSDMSIRSKKLVATSTQYIPQDQPNKGTETDGTENDLPEKDNNSEKQCNENRCRTIMDELREKIVNLQEELSQTHKEYSTRISRLESDVSELRSENCVVMRRHAASQHDVTQQAARADGLRARLRDAEGQLNDVTMQLTIERMKVAELETSLKVSKMSSQTAATLEQLTAPAEKTNIDHSPLRLSCPMPEDQEDNVVESAEPGAEKTNIGRAPLCFWSPMPADTENNANRNPEPGIYNSSAPSDLPSPVKPNEEVKYSDDSGCADLNRSGEMEGDRTSRLYHSRNKDEGNSGLTRLTSPMSLCSPVDVFRLYIPYDKETMERNLQMLNRLSELQTEVDSLRIRAAGAEELKCEEPRSSNVYRTYDENNRDLPETLPSMPDKQLEEEIPASPLPRDMGVVYELNRFDDAIDALDDSRLANAIDEPVVNIDQLEEQRQISEEKIISSEQINDFDTVTSPKQGPDLPTRSWQEFLIQSDTYADNVRNETSNTFTEPANDADDTNNPLPSPVPAIHPFSYVEKEKKKSIFSRRQLKESKKAPEEKLAKHQEKDTDIKHGETDTVSDNDQPLQPESAPTTKSSLKSSNNSKINIFDSKDNLHLQKDTAVENNINNKTGNKTDGRAGRRGSKFGATRKRLSFSVKTKKKVAEISARECSSSKEEPKGSMEESDTTMVDTSTSLDLNKPCGLAPGDQRPAGDDAVADQQPLHTNIEECELCASHVTVCHCPPRRDVINVYRTCSGTLNFQTISATRTKLRNCGCVVREDRNSTATQPSACELFLPAGPRAARDVAVATAARPLADSATYTGHPLPDNAAYSAAPRRDSATYTHPPGDARGASPDNTDLEISSLSDLPPEKDVKSFRDNLSPGEEKASTGASVSSDRGTERITDYGSLSEGELPTEKKIRTLSFGEQVKQRYASDVPSAPANSASSQMALALRSISDELARCKMLLAQQQNEFQSSRSPSRECPLERTHHLRRASAARRLPAAAPRTARFTLHVGTLVLSDEAVLSFRDMSMMLTWKFYDQSVAMTRMRPGRVVLFEFSTEYDVIFNDDFVNYLRNTEMKLTMCEITKPDLPFATCSLPLREAFLHVNRRADMSLALIAGPGMPALKRGDVVMASDELGVLDLWCVLRVEPAALRAHSRDETLSAIQTANSRKSYAGINAQEDSTWRVPDQLALLQDENKSQFQNDNATQNAATRDWPISTSSSFIRDVEDRSVEPDPDNNFGSKCTRRDSQTHDHFASVDARTDFTPSTFQLYQRDSQTQKEYPLTCIESNFSHIGCGNKWTSPEAEQPSKMIVSEVPANIKSTAEMKQALEANVSARLTKIEDELSVCPSNLSSMNSKSPNRLQDMERDKSRQSTASGVSLVRQGIVNKAKEQEEKVAAKYKNITRGLSKYVVDVSKKSVKYHDVPTPTSYPATLSGNLPLEGRHDDGQDESLDITILWLALNEECEAMVNPNINRLFVAYNFLGRSGAELETPVSLPKPKHYADKCYFNFKKTFYLHDADLPVLGHMSRCRAGDAPPDARDCIIFTVVSEPSEDPLGLSSCEDIGYAYLYLGDILEYSAGSSGYTEVVAVRAPSGVCGVLCVRLDKLCVLRRCLALPHAPADQIPSIDV